MQTKKLLLRLKILGVLVCIANHVQLLHKRKKTENDKNCLFLIFVVHMIFYNINYVLKSYLSNGYKFEPSIYRT